MAIPSVPEFRADPDLNPSQQFSIPATLFPTPYSLSWWTGQTIEDIPQESVGWLVAQGWQITSITYDTTTTPNTPRYTMTRESLNNFTILEALLNSYTDANNTAITNNTTRYNDIVRAWDDLIESSHDQFTAQSDEQDVHTTEYLATLDEYMTTVSTLITDSQAQLDLLEPDFTFHETESSTFLDDLGTTETARINEEFAAKLSVQTQDLTDRGLYSSALTTDITARNTRDRDEQIQQLNDRLNREKLENDHRLYEQQFAMRSRVIDGSTRIIANKLSQATADLGGRAAKHEEGMRLSQYQLDERNKLHVGLYGFVERRDDVPPDFQNMVQIATGLGDAGGGWVTP